MLSAKTHKNSAMAKPHYALKSERNGMIFCQTKCDVFKATRTLFVMITYSDVKNYMLLSNCHKKSCFAYALDKYISWIIDSGSKLTYDLIISFCLWYNILAYERMCLWRKNALSLKAYMHDSLL